MSGSEEVERKGRCTCKELSSCYCMQLECLARLSACGGAERDCVSGSRS